MNLELLPMVVAVFGVSLFLMPILIGGGMLLVPRTARLGRRILIYSSLSLLGLLLGCGIGFGLMIVVWSTWGEPLLFRSRNVNVSLPLAIFWASGPIGLVLGAILARRLLAGKEW